MGNYPWVETWYVIPQEATQKNLNKIIEFRQAIYANGMGKRRDALFKTWDALMLHGISLVEYERRIPAQPALLASYRFAFKPFQ